MIPDEILGSEERHHCRRCRVSFRVGLPARAQPANTFTICSEPGCKQRFWYRDTHAVVVVGIAPDDLPGSGITPEMPGSPLELGYLPELRRPWTLLRRVGGFLRQEADY